MRTIKLLLVILTALVFSVPVPWLAAVIGVCLLWYGLIYWTFKTKLVKQLVSMFQGIANEVAAKMMRDSRNAPYLFSLVGIGIYTPVLFGVSYWWQATQVEQFNWWAVFGYHVLTYGPYFQFFSQVATLIHKEGHEPRGLFKEKYSYLNRFYGYFLSFFYGHVPEAYPMGHLRIHHKYDNGPEDVTTTAPYDRRFASRWVLYLYDFMLFWTGISIVLHFYKKRRMKEARKMATGMLFYYGVITIVMSFNFWFGFAYLLLPHLSAIIFLAAINYCWHAFTDPDSPSDPYKNTITILNGVYNVYNEDYHLEHHLRPQSHWSEYPQNFEKHKQDYINSGSVVFQNTQAFEVFFWILFKRYDKMACHMVDLSGKMTTEEKMVFFKHRLRPAKL